MKKYVFALKDSKDWQGRDVTEVWISEKEYWMENECCQDWHLDEDVNIDSLLEELCMEEMMEATFETYFRLKYVKDRLLNHESFEYDEKFQGFMDSCI